MTARALDLLDVRVRRSVTTRGVRTAVPRMVLTHEKRSLLDVEVAYQPMICLVTHGAKQTRSGTRVTEVARGEALVNLVEVPVTTDFSAPFRSVTLEIELATLAEVVAGWEEASRTEPTRLGPHGIAVVTADDHLASAFERWVALTEQSPGHVEMLAPAMEREILTRVLLGPAGTALRGLVASGSFAVINAAARRLLDDLDHPISAAALADQAGMSQATFFRRFRVATGVTPGQFRKTARLRRARALLTSGTHSVGQAGRAVGYLSASQFSRDYRGHYGLSPAKDVASTAGRVHG